MQFSKSQQTNVLPIFSPCSNYFIVINQKNIYIKQASLDLKNQSQIMIKNNNTNNLQIPIVKFSPDSQYIAVYQNNRIQIYDIIGNLKTNIQHKQQGIEGILWSMGPSPQIMAFGYYQSRCTIYNLIKQNYSIVKNTKFATQNGCAFSKSMVSSSDPCVPGLLTAILQKHNNKDCIGIYFTQTWELVNHYVIDSLNASKIQFSLNGHIVVIDCILMFKVFIYDIQMGLLQTYYPNDYTLGVAIQRFSNNGYFLALGSYDQSVHLLNMYTLKPIIQLSIYKNQINANQTLVYKQQISTMNFHKIQSGIFKIQQKIKQKQISVTFSLMQFSYNDQLLAIKTDTMPNCVFIWKVQTLKLYCVIIFDLSIQVEDFKWFQNEQTLLIANGSSQLTFWTEEFDCIRCLKNQKVNFNISKISMGKGGKILFSSSSTKEKKKKYVFALKEEQ